MLSTRSRLLSFITTPLLAGAAVLALGGPALAHYDPESEGAQMGPQAACATVGGSFSGEADMNWQCDWVPADGVVPYWPDTMVGQACPASSIDAWVTFSKHGVLNAKGQVWAERIVFGCP